MTELAANLQKFDEYVNSVFQSWDIPGMAVAVVKDGEVVFAKGYGVRELGSGTPVDAETVFAIGSASKAFTAAALAMLVDEGKLKWDDLASKYLPDLRLFDPYVTANLTVRDLVTHRSGLARTDFLWYGQSHARQEILKRVRHIEPASSFRSAFGYQNVLYLAAGEIIPAVTGLSFDEFIHDRFFKPLGMPSSNTSTNDLKSVENQATPHIKVGDTVKVINWRNIDNVAPAGSINSNVTDMANWVKLQLTEGKFNGEQLLSPASLKESHSPQFIIRPDGEFDLIWQVCPDMNFMTYGLGWFVQDYKGRKVVHHGGNIDGMAAHVSLIPSEKVGVVILTNLNAAVLPMVLHFSLFDAILGGGNRDWSDHALKLKATLDQSVKDAGAQQAKSRVRGTQTSLGMDNYTGEYIHPAYDPIQVAFEGEGLVMTAGAGLVGDLTHWHFDTFAVDWRDPVFAGPVDIKQLVTFVLNADGKVAEVKTPLMGDFKRNPAPAAPTAEGLETAASVQAIEEV